MAAASRPWRAGGAARSQMFRLSSLAGKVAVDAGRRRLRIVGEQVSRHEADCVIAGVLRRHEAVDAFDDVLSTEIGAIPRDPLALDDSVRIMLVVFFADVAEEYGDVRSPIRSWTTRSRTRLGSREDGHLSAPRATCSLQRRSHAGSKLLRDLHLPGPWMHYWRSGRLLPALVENPQNRVAAFGVDVDRLLAECTPPDGVRYGCGSFASAVQRGPGGAASGMARAT